MAKVKNFARFYVLLKDMPGKSDGLKEQLVSSFTKGRTESLHGMTQDEYNAMCDSMQNLVKPSVKQTDFMAEIKRKRSSVLSRMQKLGVDTSDWAAIDGFCLDPRIAGKLFRQIGIEELTALIKKLEAISRKKPKSEKRLAPTHSLSAQQMQSLIRYSSTQQPS